MKDESISLPRVQALHPKYRDSAQSFIEDAENTLNITLRVSEGFRTFAQQSAMYAQGRTTPGNIVTFSPGGTSYHNYGLAIDLVIVNGDGSIDWTYNYNLLVPFAEKYGMTCGINFPIGKKDTDHFENTYGYNWRYLLHKYQSGDFITGTNFVNI